MKHLSPDALKAAMVLASKQRAASQTHELESPAKADEPCAAPNPYNLLHRYSLLGMATELEAMVQVQTPLLGQLCLTGQATAWYAPPNTGKTLLFLHLLTEAIEKGRVKAEDCYYVAADDNGSGLAEKLRILEEYGVHVLAPGHQGFSTDKFLTMLSAMVEKDAVRGLFIAVDTMKKFVSLMDKGESRKFGSLVRLLTIKGATFLEMAHTNKNRTATGKLVHGGTSDILEDFDCGYVIDQIPDQTSENERIVNFDCIKSRGNVAQSVAYAYSLERDISYAEKLASVREIDPSQFERIKHAADMMSDSEIIEAIKLSIGNGVTQKMKLARAIAATERVGRQAVINLIEKYTGDDPVRHHWDFTIKARGAKEYVLLADPT